MSVGLTEGPSVNESAWLYSTCRPFVVEVWKVIVVLGAALRFEKRNQPVKSSAISMMCFGPGGSGGCRHTARELARHNDGSL